MLEPHTQRLKVRAALLSLASNTVLIALKIVVGVAIGSVSVVSEAVHSSMDLLAAGLALFAVRHSGKPADREHPYGHGKLENVSGTLEAMLVLAAGTWIVYEAIRRLMHPQPMSEAAWGVAVMGFSAAANVLVSEVLFRVGRQTESVALQADAWNLRSDVFTSAGVTVSLLVIWVARWAAPGTNLEWLDPVAAILVAILIIRVALKLSWAAIRDLLDWRLPPAEEQWIRQYLSDRKPTVRAFHRLRTRRSGAARFIDLHVRVDGGMSLHEAHALSGEVAAGIRARFPGSNVTIHIEPCVGACAEACSGDCLLTEAEREDVRRGQPRGRAGRQGSEEPPDAADDPPGPGS